MSPEQRACSRLSGETGHIGRLLMIGPSEALFDELRRQAGPRDHDLQSCANCVEALLQLRLHSWDVLLTDPATTIGDTLPVAREVSLDRSNDLVRSSRLAARKANGSGNCCTTDALQQQHDIVTAVRCTEWVGDFGRLESITWRWWT